MAENEELDVIRNGRGRQLISTVRGAPSLYDEVVLHEFDRCFVPSLRRACKLLDIRALIKACINGDSHEIERLRREHHRQRDRAETFAEQIMISCRPGMRYREAVDAF